MMNLRVIHIVRDYLPVSETFTNQTIRLINTETGRSQPVLSFFRSNPDKFQYQNIKSLFSTSLNLNFRASRISIAFLIHLLSHFAQYANLYFYRRAFSLLRFKKKFFLNAINEIKPDILHFHFGWTFNDFCKITNDNLPDVPIVISFHGSDITKFARDNDSYRQRLQKFALRDNVQFIAVSEYLKKEIVKIGIPDDKICVVYNTLNESLFQPVRPDKKNNTIQILNVGRHVSCKGQEYLIKAFSHFLKFHDGHLTLVGDGELKSKYEELVNEMRLVEKVTFTGALPPGEVSKLMNNSDIYVQPSVNEIETGQCESFGVVVLEAIATGLPVIVTNIGGLPEVVGNDETQSGLSYFLIKEKNENDIFFALKQFSENRLRPDPEYLKERVRYFSNSEFIKKLLAVYLRAVDSK